MFQTARSGVSYSIPFDELDLRYIRKDVKRNNNPLPIWSIDNNKQYYSFEVFVEKRCNEDCKKNNLQEVTEISDTPKENTYKCPICNIIVPIIYLKEHNSSLKHKTCLEIADLAMQRLRDYVFLNVTACTNETSTYFCEPCALSVDVNQKYCHEASKSHAVSLKYDNILSDLLMLYKDRENLDKICSKYLLNVETNEIAMTKPIKSVEDNTKTTANTAATKKTVVNNETDPELVDLIDYFENINANLDGQGHISVTDKDFILITVDNSKLRVNILNFHGFSTCEDSDETFCLLCRVILKSADLEAHCKNGKHIDNISVPLRDQHCVRSIEISAWHIHCILCNKCIYTKRIDDHFRSETHTLALNESLIDETVNANDISIGTAKDLKEDHSLDIFTATEDDTDSHYETGDDVSLHSVPKLTPAPTNEPLHYQMNVSTNPKEVTCRVCKVVVPNKIIKVIVHIMAKNHKTKYDALLLNNKLKRTENGFNCHFCQVDINNTNELEHMDSEAHQKAMKTLNDYPTINIKYCAACKEYIRNSELDVHESTAKHKSNLEIQPAKEEKIIPTLNIYCAVCKEYIPNSVLDVHESTAKHKSNLKTQPAKEEKIIPTLSIYCAVCKEYIPNSVLDVHESTAKHKSNLKTQPAKEEKIIPTLSIYCAVCKEYIPNSVLDVHKSTAKHKNNLETQPTKEEKNIIISKTNIHYHLQKTNIASELKCTICNVSVPSKSNCITEHIMGNIHTSRYDMFLVKNKLKKVENGFHCDICKVKITNMNELSHINGKNHQKNILTFNQSDPVKDITSIQPNDINDENAAIPSTSSNFLKIVTKYCRPCNIYVDANNFTSHERGKRHKENLKLNEIDSVSTTTTTSSTSVSGMTYCQSCNIHIHTHNIDSHTKGNKHLKQLKISETKPVDTHLAVISKYLCYLMSPTEDPNELMCKICKIAIAKSNLMSHLKARRHKKKYNTLLSSNKVRKIETGFHCDICEVNMTDMNEFNHIFNETHQYKIANEAHVTIEADETVTNSNNTLDNVTDLQTQEDEENYSSLLC